MRTHEGHGGERGGTALVLCGGGSKGAIEVGFYRALGELGIRPDLVVGSSVGAVNGAFIAAGVPVDAMVRHWTTLRRRDLLAFNWSLLWKGLAADSLYTFGRFRRYLESRLPVLRFEELRVPLLIVTTELQAGKPYLWDEGDLVDAILASCAIPGIFPPVRGPGGRLLVDGGLVNNLPTDVAVARGGRVVLGILCRCCTQSQRPTHGLSRLLGQAFGIALECITRRGLYAGRRDAEVFILESDLGLDVEALDFSHSAELIESAYRFSLPRLAAWLERVEAQRAETRLEDDATLT